MTKQEKKRLQDAYRLYVRLTEGRSKQGNLKEGKPLRLKPPSKNGSVPPEN